MVGNQAVGNLFLIRYEVIILLFAPCLLGRSSLGEPRSDETDIFRGIGFDPDLVRLRLKV